MASLAGGFRLLLDTFLLKTMLASCRFQRGELENIQRCTGF